MITIVYLISIVFDAIGDGLNQTERKGAGHLFFALSILALLLTPFVFKTDLSKWYIYIFAYSFLRFAIFDLCINLTKKQKWNFNGSTNYLDRFFAKYPSFMKTFVQIISLIMAVSLTMRYLW